MSKFKVESNRIDKSAEIIEADFYYLEDGFFNFSNDIGPKDKIECVATIAANMVFYIRREE